jgi:cobalt/nickel transport system permease protein
MQLNLTEQYRRGASFFHRLDPRIKLLGTLAFILTATTLPFGAWLGYLLLFVPTLIIASVARLGWGYAFRRSFVALPFALAAITLPFTVPGRPIFHLGGLEITAEGSIRFLSILLKSWLSVQVAILMTATTTFPDLLWAMRALKLPPLLVSIIGFMYRYLFVLGDEASRLLRARAARSAAGSEGSGGSFWWRGRVTGNMVGSLAIRAFERSERVYDAMVARGFQGEMKTLAPPVLSDQDRYALTAWVAYLVAARLVEFFL